MTLVVVLVLLALILAGAGFALHVLWWGLLILAAVFVVDQVLGRRVP